MKAPVSKMMGLTFLCRSPRTHSQCTNTQGIKNGENNNLQVWLSQFVAFLRHFCGFCFPLSPWSQGWLDAAARWWCSAIVPPTPTTHQTTFLTAYMMSYIMYNTPLIRIWAFPDHFWCFWPSCAGSTTISPWWAVVLLTRRTNMCALLIKPRSSVPLLLHYRSFHRPLNLTPTARSGCGIHSLVIHFLYY